MIDFSLKLPVLDPVFPGGAAQALMGIPESLGGGGTLAQPLDCGLGEKAPVLLAPQKTGHLFSPGCSWQLCSQCPQPAPKAKGASVDPSVPPTDSPAPTIRVPAPGPSLYFLLTPTPPLEGGDAHPLAGSLPQPRLLLQGFCRPQGHTALSGNYSSGQLSLAFLSSESRIFLPLFGADLVAGQRSRASSQGEHS